MLGMGVHTTCYKSFHTGPGATGKAGRETTVHCGQSYKTEFLPGKPLQLQSSDNTFPLKQFHTCQKLLHNAISSKEAEQEVT